ncbi:hypothetical protein A0J61_05374 [Choanephora cucurbitarum]|uniref:Uncharacterized protein n=1 Tax=Choanephora cucurbitarum TaxID=101091 RepID=A0A1C7NC73_9FUNG|nr:hypothetical protein A0J61_05374 [Choanephora cucurbitarum]
MSKEGQEKFVFNKQSNHPDTKPHQHRCNAHLEDFLEGILAFDLVKPFGVFLDCLRSQPGQEPPRYQPKDKQ